MTNNLSIADHAFASDKLVSFSVDETLLPRSILQYGCTTWTLTKRKEKKLDGNCTRILRAILNKF